MSAPPTVVALSGNPRPGSRTALVAEKVADRVAELLGGAERARVDLSELAGEVFDPHSARVAAATATVAGARVLVVATPTYKATYTGLLKSFLDRYGNAGLAGVVAVPVQVAGNPVHLLAAEVHLRPLLVELGAQVPTRALTLTESQLGGSQVAESPTTVSQATGPSRTAVSQTTVSQATGPSRTAGLDDRVEAWLAAEGAALVHAARAATLAGVGA